MKIQVGKYTFHVPANDRIFSNPKKVEKRHVQEVDRVIASIPTFKPGGILFELGACFGVTTIPALMSGLFSRAVVVEPHVGNLELLERNLREAGLSDVVSVIPHAISNASGFDRLTECERNTGGHHLDFGSSKGVTTVKTCTVDEALEISGVKPEDLTLVWCDIQGAEAFMLKGAFKTLESGAPWHIEFHFRLMRALNHLLSLLSSAMIDLTPRFDLFSLVGDEPTDIARFPEVIEQLSGKEGFSNIVFWKKE